ncbi:MAG: hypothetical protein M3380_20215 [Chloroflexota bacterium]|nr:hypothetical protein [Chloroflexota bacterium]
MRYRDIARRLAALERQVPPLEPEGLTVQDGEAIAHALYALMKGGPYVVLWKHDRTQHDECAQDLHWAIWHGQEAAAESLEFVIALHDALAAVESTATPMLGDYAAWAGADHTASVAARAAYAAKRRQWDEDRARRRAHPRFRAGYFPPRPGYQWYGAGADICEAERPAPCPYRTCRACTGEE